MSVLKLVFTFLSYLPRSVRERIVPDMRIPPISNNPGKVQLDRLGHVYFEHPDLDKFSEFAKTSDSSKRREPRTGYTIAAMAKIHMYMSRQEAKTTSLDSVVLRLWLARKMNLIKLPS